ncbi:daunorubicin resistance protein DrrA family ABC transporter ATP-binding protein [Actinopolymorpha alba]|uniref:daunorubicin resistance protein DrrA family ABC transporter ATP-binding protein n=1 Tax=Actinopolymorpha alba TaxID=533267 RepID=UPI00037992D8|nr:daunorubicin resistance protein DrrA family ABC transporter ATP-binding protein [Actinopolymorpha alba]
MITAQGLKKTFRSRRGSVEAVRGVDLSVEAGGIVGFLGPNGAGKTTTLRMLTTLLEPTEGTATVAGFDLRANPVGVRRSIGYVSQAGGSAPEALVGEELEYHARFYGLSRGDARRRSQDLLPQLDLAGLDTRQVKTLSGGQRRRLDIAMGLVHSPGLVFLDEPTTGLDPQSRANMWEHIRRLRNNNGTTVFLTTHYLEEADALCDRIFVIDAGLIVASGTADELKQQVSGDLVQVEVASGTEGDIDKARGIAAGRPGAEQLTVDGAVVSFRVSRGDEAVVGLLRDLDAAGIALSSLQVQRPTLDDVFLALTGHALRDGSE